jgi:superoxide reductase
MKVKNKNEVYKCEICGNIVNILYAGGGELVCCGKPMVLQVENTIEASIEKHIPIVEETSSGVLIKVGETTHPMTDEHYIEWIEIITDDGKIYRQDLQPGQKPQAEFNIPKKGVLVRAYCNLHGLWKNK